MNRIRVNASRPYDVIIGSGLLENISNIIRETCPRAERVLVVSDSNVAPYHLKNVCDSLKNFAVSSFVFEAGEKSKNLTTIDAVYDACAGFGMTRTDLILSLGGGVTTDMAGFAAATYMRGIPVIHMPTSLLCDVDASIGGKTGVDHPSGKNIIGAFYQPSCVIINVDFLSSLPDAVFTEGMAEVIKYAFIMDKELFSLLEKNNIHSLRSDISLLEKVITRCAADKIEIVNEDEFDNGRRQLLNFGHTVGHVIELASNFNTSHGEAVALGMAIIARASVHAAICDNTVCDSLLKLLNSYGLPSSYDYSPADIAHSAMHDKKARGSVVSLIVLEDIGRASIHKMNESEIKEFLTL